MMDTESFYPTTNQYSETEKIQNQENKNPLHILMNILVKSIAPPSISALLNSFSSMEGWEDFIDIVNEYTPEVRDQILRETTPHKQMKIFIDTFNKKYFPLDRDWVLDNIDNLDENPKGESYTFLTNNVPVEVIGWDFDQYDGLPSENETFLQLLCYLLPNPGDENDERVALADACHNIVPQAILAKVPAKGFPFDRLHEMLDGTKYSFVAKFGDWLSANTGNYFMDTDNESYWNGYQPEWEPGTIKELVRCDKEANQFFADRNKFQEWLEKDTVKNFQKLLNFMLKKYNQEGKVKHDNKTNNNGGPLIETLNPGNGNETLRDI